MIKTSTKSTSALLTARKVSCMRDERLLFDDLSFDLYAGELLQLEGPNGAGKTSLLRLLAGLLPFNEGELFWQGHNINTCRDNFYQSMLFIGHLAGIKAELSPLENLHWFAALEGIKDETLLDNALSQVGLAGYEDQPCHQLSAGQKRRVALARLTFTQRSVWLLDEPFTALDKTAVASVENLLIKHSQAGGAVILTSHHALEELPGLKKLTLGEVT